jgi:hypothetical protein
MPVILMVGHETKGLMARAKAAGMAMVLETPLMGAALSDAIAATIKGNIARPPQRPS